MTINTAMLEKWKPEAWALQQPIATHKLPLYALLGEAVDVARFFQTHYETEVDTNGYQVRAGLEQAENGGQFRQSLGQEILELVEATQAAQTHHLLAVSEMGSPTERAAFVLSEIRAALEFVFDDGVEDEQDVRLERLAQIHANPTSQDALAAALVDYSSFAAMHRDRLENLRAFESEMIDEADALVITLRNRSANRLAGTDRQEQEASLELRNRLATLLYDRMQLVRAAARYVFRHDQQTARRASSRYQRRRNARYRRRSTTSQGAADSGASATGEETNTASSPPTPTDTEAPSVDGQQEGTPSATEATH